MSDGDRLGSRQSMNRNLRDQLRSRSQASAAPPSSELPQPTPEGRVEWLDRGTENRGLSTPLPPPHAPRSSPSTSRPRRNPALQPTRPATTQRRDNPTSPPTTSPPIPPTNEAPTLATTETNQRRRFLDALGRGEISSGRSGLDQVNGRNITAFLESPVLPGMYAAQDEKGNFYFVSRSLNGTIENVVEAVPTARNVAGRSNEIRDRSATSHSPTLPAPPQYGRVSSEANEQLFWDRETGRVGTDQDDLERQHQAMLSAQQAEHQRYRAHLRELERQAPTEAAERSREIFELGRGDQDRQDAGDYLVAQEKNENLELDDADRESESIKMLAIARRASDRVLDFLDWNDVRRLGAERAQELSDERWREADFHRRDGSLTHDHNYIRQIRLQRGGVPAISSPLGAIATVIGSQMVDRNDSSDLTDVHIAELGQAISGVIPLGGTTIARRIQGASQQTPSNQRRTRPPLSYENRGRPTDLGAAVGSVGRGSNSRSTTEVQRSTTDRSGTPRRQPSRPGLNETTTTSRSERAFLQQRLRRLAGSYIRGSREASTSASRRNLNFRWRFLDKLRTDRDTLSPNSQGMLSLLSEAELVRLVDIVRRQSRSYRRGRRSDQIPQGSISNVQGALQESVFRTKFWQDGLDMANTMRRQPPQDRNILSVGPVRIVDRAHTPGMRRGRDGNLRPSLNEITDGLIFSEITYQTPQGVRNGIIIYCQSSVKSATNLIHVVRRHRARNERTGRQEWRSPQTAREQRRFGSEEVIIEIPGRTSSTDPEGFSGSHSIRLSPDQIFFHSSFTVFTSAPRDVAAVTFRKDVAGWRHSGRLPKE
jgi:hypothetical protein